MKIGYFGDSAMAGVAKGWAAQLSAKVGIALVDFGSDGDTSSDIVTRWRTEAESAGLDRLIFCFGSNDCKLLPNTRITVGQVERLKNAKAIMMAARDKWPTVFISPMPIAGDDKANERISEMTRQLGAVAQINKVAYVNIFDALLGSAPWREHASLDAAADLIAAHPVWQGWFKA